MREIRLAIMWHMHQPLYVDSSDRNYMLPWVRLHGLKDYYGMVAILREFPKVKMTFNLVPSLLEQLLEYCAGTAEERFQSLSMKSASELTDEDKIYILKNFFMANRQTMISIYPRYDALLMKRGSGVEDQQLRRIARIYSTQDFLDLQVLQKLAWVDEEYRRRDARVVDLIARGKNYSEADKKVLAEVEQEILAKIVPEHRDAAARGQIEISTSPYYHPILPLLCDSNVARLANPRAKLLKEPFRHPEDAATQLREGRRLFKEVFGWEPVGLWPSEGSVSMEALQLAAAEGFRWVATDEEILEQSVGIQLGRTFDGGLARPDMLFRPYRLGLGDKDIGVLFRDHVLSDLIGFTYSKMPPKEAADDFIGRLERIGHDWQGDQAPVVPIILDGENAWEYYRGDGREFLRRVYGLLQESRLIETITCAQAFEQGPPLPLPQVTPGSWINHNFDIWIGHDEDRKAWEMLHQARSLLAARDPDRSQQKAWQEIYIAEGSDWCWWYGGDHSSENDWEFDQLFRKRLINVYNLLGESAPPGLHVSIISERKKGLPPPVTPTRFITPRIDGRLTTYFEWLGAGEVRVTLHGTAMHKTRHITHAIAYGFNLDEMYVRVDTAGRASSYFAGGMELRIVFLAPADYAVVCRCGGEEGSRLYCGSREIAACHFAVDSVVEGTIPFKDLGVKVGDRLEFYVSWQRGQETFESQPEGASIALEVPNETFENQYWEV
ncbi:MAG: glycoside hydrolase family 57 protein [Acidobacteriota bacterium]